MIKIIRDSVVRPSALKLSKHPGYIRLLSHYYKSNRVGARNHALIIERQREEILNKSLSAVYSLFKNKCAFCESIIAKKSIVNVGYFRPKENARGFGQGVFRRNYYWWLSLEWNNIYLICSECDKYKSTWFPVENDEYSAENTDYAQIIDEENPLLIDPCLDEPQLSLLFLGDGYIEPKDEKGKVTNDIVKLNRTSIINARKEAIKEEIKRLEHIKDNPNSPIFLGVQKGYEELFSDNPGFSYCAFRRAIIQAFVLTDPDLSLTFTGNGLHDIIQKKCYYSIYELGQIKESYLSSLEKLPTKKIKKEVKSVSKSYDHLYLDKLEVKNFGGIYGRSIINFGKNEEKRREPIKALIGENGSGKSSILKALALCLCGKNYYLKHLKEHAEKLFHENKESYLKLYTVDGEVIVVKKEKKGVFYSHSNPVNFCLGYGSIRMEDIKGDNSDYLNTNIVNVKNLFDPHTLLDSYSVWINELKPKEIFYLKDALLNLLEKYDKYEIELERNQLYLKEIKKEKIKIEDLSEGYRTLFIVALDIIHSILQKSDGLDIKVAEGIILIDEIGAHLHPRWKMVIIKKLKTVFPKLQFIYSTHDPLCLYGLKENEVVVLEKTDNKTLIRDNLPSPEEFSPEHLLKSEFFGLKSTVSPEMEYKYNRYYYLLRKSSLEKLNKKLKSELNNLKVELNNYKTMGNSLREELAFYAIDKLLANNPELNREELKEETLKEVSEMWKKNDFNK